jgi:hypothetical protein
MATNDELERIRRELEHLNARWRPNKCQRGRVGSVPEAKNSARGRLVSPPKVARSGALAF